MKSISFYLLAFIVILSSCTKGSTIKGTVYCPINDEPLSSVVVTALTSTNIEQDKKFEIITSKTNVNGEFVLKGLSDKYVYDVFVSSDNIESNRMKVKPPEKGQTLLLDEPILAIASPVRPGIYIYQDGKHIELLYNNTADVFDFYRSYVGSNYFPYKPTNIKEPKIILSDYKNSGGNYTDWVSGKLSNVSDLGSSYDINKAAFILYIGESYYRYIFCGMFFYPEINIASGLNLVVPEGYYAGISEIRGRDIGYNRQNIDYLTGLNERLGDLCNNSVGEIRYSKLSLPIDAYFAIYNPNDGKNIILIHTK